MLGCAFASLGLLGLLLSLVSALSALSLYLLLLLSLLSLVLLQVLGQVFLGGRPRVTQKLFGAGTVSGAWLCLAVPGRAWLDLCLAVLRCANAWPVWLCLAVPS